MREQTFIIDGHTVTYVGIDIIDQDQAERWYRSYTSGGHCPFVVESEKEEHVMEAKNRFWETGVPLESPYIAHTQEQERQSTEDYIEYCKYAQKLQTELSEGSMFIQDELDYIALELAGIEEERIDLSAREGDLHRQIAYLRTLQSLTNKRKSELNREYEQTAKERDTSESGDSGGVKMDNQQGDTRND